MHGAAVTQCILHFVSYKKNSLNDHFKVVIYLSHSCRYLSSKDPSCVNYMTFSDEVESIFTTKHLEKMPTAQVVQFVPNPEVDCNFLSPEEEQILQKTLHRLAERVRVLKKPNESSPPIINLSLEFPVLHKFA